MLHPSSSLQRQNQLKCTDSFAFFDWYVFLVPANASIVLMLHWYCHDIALVFLLVYTLIWLLCFPWFLLIYQSRHAFNTSAFPYLDLIGWLHNGNDTIPYVLWYWDSVCWQQVISPKYFIGNFMVLKWNHIILKPWHLATKIRIDWLCNYNDLMPYILCFRLLITGNITQALVY